MDAGEGTTVFDATDDIVGVREMVEGVGGGKTYAVRSAYGECCGISGSGGRANGVVMALNASRCISLSLSVGVDIGTCLFALALKNGSFGRTSTGRSRCCASNRWSSRINDC